MFDNTSLKEMQYTCEENGPATHPGEVLKDEIIARGITQKQLAEMTGFSPSVISGIVSEKRSVSQRMAVALEKALGISADMWMNLQIHYNNSSRKITDCKGTYHHQLEIVSPAVMREMDWSCAIIDKIESILERKGITNQELADRIGCNESQIIRWTRGFPNFTLSSLAKLSEALGEPLIEVK